MLPQSFLPSQEQQPKTGGMVQRSPSYLPVQMHWVKTSGNRDKGDLLSGRRRQRLRNRSSSNKVRTQRMPGRTFRSLSGTGQPLDVFSRQSPCPRVLQSPFLQGPAPSDPG